MLILMLPWKIYLNNELTMQFDLWAFLCSTTFISNPIFVYKIEKKMQVY